MNHSKLENEDEREHYVNWLFSNIAHNYDRLNGIISFGLHQRWRKFAVSKAQLTSRSLVLDLCCGTADLAICAAKEGNEIMVVGIDFCEKMLEVGKKKVKKLGLEDRIELKKQKISPPLPFEKNIFDVVTIGFGLRHLNIKEIFKEVNRILKPNGRLVTLDLASPRGVVERALHRMYFTQILPFLGKIFHGDGEPYRYLFKSMELYLPNQEDLKKVMEESGFEKVKYFNLLRGIVAIHMGLKRNG